MTDKTSTEKPRKVVINISDDIYAELAYLKLQTRLPMNKLILQVIAAGLVNNAKV